MGGVESMTEGVIRPFKLYMLPFRRPYIGPAINAAGPHRG